MTATAANARFALAPINTSRSRDSYGRSVTSLNLLGRTLVVVVTMPKSARDAGMHPYLVNEWDAPAGDDQPHVSYFGTRKAALEFATWRAEVAAAPRRENIRHGRGNVPLLP